MVYVVWFGYSVCLHKRNCFNTQLVEFERKEGKSARYTLEDHAGCVVAPGLYQSSYSLMLHIG